MKRRVVWRKPKRGRRVGRKGKKNIRKRTVRKMGPRHHKNLAKKAKNPARKRVVHRAKKRVVHRARNAKKRNIIPPPQPPLENSLVGIKNYGNTCYHNAAIKLLKMIPGLTFNNQAFDRVYRTRENNITEPMVMDLVQQCGFRWKTQNDAVEMVMMMLFDVLDKRSFEITWEMEHYIMYIRDCLPLFNGLTNRVRSTRRPDRAQQFRLVNVEDKPYARIQDLMNVLRFSAGGPGDYSITTDFNDPDYSPIDYVWKDGSKTTLRELMVEAGSSILPSCKREVYTPSSDYVILTLDTIDFTRRTKKTKLRFTDIAAPIRFVNGVSYTPVSIVCHLGSSISLGHYINYSLEQGGWTLYNDDRVSTGIDIKAIQGSPYMLLYRKM
jgi:hypothetical protein